MPFYQTNPPGECFRRFGYREAFTRAADRRWNVCPNQGQHGDRAPWLQGERFGSSGGKKEVAKHAFLRNECIWRGGFGVRIGLLCIGKGEEMAL